MRPEDVPNELAALGTHAVDMHPSTSFLAPCESLARAVLAAVLPEYEKQVRARLAAAIADVSEARDDEDPGYVEAYWDGRDDAATIARGES